MKIRKLEICGFKSFVDKTVLHFDQDITGVVGPNGCGKSNVVDAIKWAMGEQSAQRLRGKSMDDVIFNGAEGRSAHGFAEVSITFDNTDGLAPPEYRDYAEITVTRRIDRQGRSDYRINRTAVRLLDITNLFLGTGVGKRAYSIIEQGRVGFIVSAKAEDRRQIIEEAAGITKFKARRKAAERKMEQTRQNLLRVQDVLRELERNLGSLQRQAQKAERYKNYRAELRDLELHLASHRWLELFGERRRLGQAHASVAEQEEARARTLTAQESTLEAHRIAQDKAAEALEQQQNAVHAQQRRLQQFESTQARQLERLQALRDSEALARREREDLQAQHEALQGELGQCQGLVADYEARQAMVQTQLQGAEQAWRAVQEARTRSERAVAGARDRRSALEQQGARLEGELAAFVQRRDDNDQRQAQAQHDMAELTRQCGDSRQQVTEAEAALEALQADKTRLLSELEAAQKGLVEARQAVQQAQRGVDEARQAAAHKRSRLRSLEEIVARCEGLDAGVRALVGKRARSDAEALAAPPVLGLVADAVDCPQEWTAALAAGLAEGLHEVVVPSLTDSQAALAWLNAGRLGRATVAARDLGTAAPNSDEAPAALPDAPGVLGWLSDHVQVDRARVGESWRRRLNRILLVERIDDALQLWQSGWRAGPIVSRAGERIDVHGALTGGSGDDAGVHVIALRREVRGLHHEVATLEAALHQAVTAHEAAGQTVTAASQRLEASKSAQHAHELAAVRAEQRLQQLRQQGLSLAQRQARLQTETQRLTEVGQRLQAQQAEGQQRLAQLSEARQQAEAALSEAQAELSEQQSTLQARTAALTEAKVEATQLRERLQSSQGSLGRLRRSVQELEGRQTRLDDALRRGAEQQGQTAALIIAARADGAHAVLALQQGQQALAAAREAAAAARQAAAESEEAVRSLRQRQHEASQQVHGLRLQLRELELAEEHLLAQIFERYRLHLPHVLPDYHARPLPDGQMQGRVEELTRLIERMGEINLLAIEEYAESATRHESLQTQKGDLEEALSQLERAIRQMNRESKARFREAFEAINTRFQVVFPRLFGGGQAHLRLSDAGDLLESGIEIHAQPPGKKLGSLELMSGGEKALTAVSLIFAVFQYKPSPFCLLDEVDAPLDEANVGRFTDAIRQMTQQSQFIVITHSKTTMEATDVLYGVTMEQPGISKLVSVKLRPQTSNAA
ncbi:MAG: chromosome segregation protein SMC [Polyangiales bacterium]